MASLPQSVRGFFSVYTAFSGSILTFWPVRLIVRLWAASPSFESYFGSGDGGILEYTFGLTIDLC